MKSGVKIAAAAITLSIVTMGAASAMIPQVDLKKNLFPDEGVAPQVLSDIDNNSFKYKADAFVGDLSEKRNSAEPLTRYHHQLVGKHII